jgi:hypothetical protein
MSNINYICSSESKIKLYYRIVCLLLLKIQVDKLFHFFYQYARHFHTSETSMTPKTLQLCFRISFQLKKKVTDRLVQKLFRAVKFLTS